MSDPDSSHHGSALFCLIPLNKPAVHAVEHPNNRHLVTRITSGWVGLKVGSHRSETKHTLATLGRARNADIYVEGASISKIQCSFEIEPTSGAVMLYDQSRLHTTQVYGANATPFEHGRVRKVLVQAKLNTEIGLGGRVTDHARFRLHWFHNRLQTAKGIKAHESNTQEIEDNPRLALTIDELETVLPSRMVTGIYTTSFQQLKMRFVQGDELGAGQFGKVFKAIDIDTGKLMAVKILSRPGGTSEEAWRHSVHLTLKREVETLSQISHSHIVNYIASQGWDGPAVEIFMGLKDGNVRSLVTCGSVQCTYELAWSIFHQMLQALDCLAVHGVVHRDVKPENILYTSRPDGQYLFQLGDFGLCNHSLAAVTTVGTPIYMAPEVYRREEQTHKMDIWSLFVTMAWILDVEGFRLKSDQFQSTKAIEQTVLAVAASSTVNRIQEMARIDPARRASAAQMLVKCFKGEGLTTPQDQIPPIMDPENPKPNPPLDQFRIQKPRAPRQKGVVGQNGMVNKRQAGEPATRRRPNPRGVNTPGFMPGLRWRAQQNTPRLPPSGSGVRVPREQTRWS